MDSQERQWKLDKVGYMSASELGLLNSASGKFTQTNLSYLYKIERQRSTGNPPPPVFSKNFDIGTEQEPYAFDWIQKNHSGSAVLLSKVFKKVDWATFGASVDVLDGGEEGEIIEIKTLVSEGEINWFMSPSVPFDKKRQRALKLHKDQMVGQLLAYPKVDTIWIMKYNYQNDDDPFDLLPTDHPSRGLMFKFTREEFGIEIEKSKKRIIFADEYLKSGRDLELING